MLKLFGIIGAGLSLFLVLRVNQAQAGGTTNCRGTARTVGLPVEFSNDGAFGAGAFDFGQGSAKCKGTNGGRYTYATYGVSESVAVQPLQPCTVPGGTENGGITLNIIEPSGGLNDDGKGDVIYAEGSSGTLCLDISSGPPYNFSGSETGVFTGGTGKWQGATGTWTNNITGVDIVAPGATNQNAYGFLNRLTISSTSTVNTP